MALVATIQGLADNASANLAPCTIAPTNGTASLALSEGVDYAISGTVTRVELNSYAGRGECAVSFTAGSTCTFVSPSTWGTFSLPDFESGKSYTTVVREMGGAIVIIGAEFSKGA